MSQEYTTNYFRIKVLKQIRKKNETDFTNERQPKEMMLLAIS